MSRATHPRHAQRLHAADIAEYNDVERIAPWLQNWWLDPATSKANDVIGHDRVLMQAMRNSSTVAASAERLTASYVAQARSWGLTWDEIGYALGVSRQAAQKRYSA